MRNFLSALAAAFLLLSADAGAAVRLFNLFKDNAVLQRDKPCAIWGWADKGETVAIQLKAQSFKSTADAKGRWKIMLPPQPAGGPFVITVSGSNAIILHNVMFGDVWICGGQSNMQMRVRKTGYSPDSAKDNNPFIRVFTVAVATDFVPLDTLGGGEWEVASLASVPEFSATPYFFGRQLQETLHVPIGLINNSLGSTLIETWMSPDAISAFPQFKAFYDAFLRLQKGFAAYHEAFEKARPDWERRYYLKDDPGLEQKWFLPETDVSGWKPMTLPAYWEDKGLPDYDGSVWFRRGFDLPAEYAHSGARINLGEVDDYHIAWVNGHKVGETFGNKNYTTYPVPDSVLKPAGNVLVVRVFDAGGKGGMHDFMWHQELAGEWRYKPGVRIKASAFKKPVLANASTYSSPSLLYNGSIAPLTPAAIKGVIWYQGESNAPRAEEYRELFPAMIRDWRAQFAQGDFPFLFVQLANYGVEPSNPEESAWAELREAQAAALSLPNTAMTVAIDIGEAADLHPKNKPELGKRMGITALKQFYNARIVDMSPFYDHMQVRGDSIFLFFKNITINPLATDDKYGYVRGFTIAGADRIFRWAKATIRAANTVIVYAEGLHTPVAVRYGWADNPGRLDLYNSAGWPAVPFRTDNWPMKTAGKKAEVSVE